MDYFEFIKDPQPAEIWCDTPNNKHGLWKPFAGPVSAAARHTIKVVLYTLLNYLVKQQYLMGNPLANAYWPATSVKPCANVVKTETAILMLDEWAALLKTIDSLPENSWVMQQEKYLLRFIVELLYFLRLRPNQLAKHTWNSFYAQADQWWFFAPNKQDQCYAIPVQVELLAAIQQYRTFLGYTPLPTTEDKRPIIQCGQRKNAVCAAQMDKMLKKLAVRTANQYFLDKPQQYLKLKAFSAHWLRQFASMMHGILTEG